MRAIGSLVAAVAVGAFALGAAGRLAVRHASGHQQPGTGGRSNVPAPGPADTDENAQPRTLPKLPSGMTIQMIVQGDSIYRGKGGCVTCHGADATGMPNAGSGLTRGVAFIPNEWQAIDSLTTAGISEALTRTAVAMPPRGAQSNLTPEETRLVAAYVWAIAHVRGEPWPGGHRTHATEAAQGARADTTAAPKQP